MIIFTTTKRLKQDKELVKKYEEALSATRAALEKQSLLVETQSRLIGILEMELTILKSKG